MSSQYYTILHFLCRSEDVARGGRVRALEIDMVATMWNKFGLKHYVASENIVRCAIGQLFNNAKVPFINYVKAKGGIGFLT